MVDASLQSDLDDLGVEVSQKKEGASNKRLVLVILLPLLLIGGAGAGRQVSSVLETLLSSQEAEVDAATGPLNIVFYDLPEMLVNLNSSGTKSYFLKLAISLEVTADEDVAQLEKSKSRIVDSFQVYLRELRIEDLAGSAGIQRLREELLLRVNAAASQQLSAMCSSKKCSSSSRPKKPRKVYSTCLTRHSMRPMSTRTP